MTRDNGMRTSLFARRFIQVERIALNMEQIEEHSPPPNPAKETDARFEGYRKQHGDESWELDALSPDFIAELVRSHVRELIDEARWDAAISEEEANREMLGRVSQRWADVVAMFGEED